MTWKLISARHRPPLAVDMDQIGMLIWIIGVLTIALKLVLTTTNQAVFLHAVALAGLASYTIGLVLAAIGVLHVLRTHLARLLSRSSIANHRYAKPALLPLWYRQLGVASERRHTWLGQANPLRFDHGRACIWGVEYLIAAAMIHAALELAAEQPIWAQLGWLAVCIPLRTLLIAVHDQITAHGHGSAAS